MSLSPTIRPCGPSPASEAHSLLDLAAGLLDRWVVAPLAVRMERARLRDELAGLDHRELKDIGITDIDTFVAGWNPRA